MVNWLFRSLRNQRRQGAFQRRSSERRYFDHRARRPRFERLEDRLMLTTLVVNNPTDTAVAAELSLRQAVAQANTDAAAGTSRHDHVRPQSG